MTIKSKTKKKQDMMDSNQLKMSVKSQIISHEELKFA